MNDDQLTGLFVFTPVLLIISYYILKRLISNIIPFVKKHKSTLFLMVIIAFAITPLPYGIYPWLKFIIMSWFAWFALLSFNNGRIAWTLFWLAFLVLFNPFWPFILGKDGWVIVDLFMICALLFWMYDGETEWIEYEKDDEDAEDAS